MLPIPISSNVLDYLEVMSDDKARELLDTEYLYNEDVLNYTPIPLTLGRFDLMDFTGQNFVP